MTRSLNILLLLVMALPLSAQYQIEGTVNLGPDWQPKIYLAAVKKLSDYYRTGPDMIVNTAPIDSNGYFILRGDNLPEEQQFYRIYLMKKQNTEYDACFYADAMDHNFAHILLGNGAQLSISANPQSPAPFGKYSVIGNQENES